MSKKYRISALLCLMLASGAYGDSVNGGGARLSVAVDVISDAPFQVKQSHLYRQARWNSVLPLNVQSGAQVLRVDMPYE